MMVFHVIVKCRRSLHIGLITSCWLFFALVMPAGVFATDGGSVYTDKNTVHEWFWFIYERNTSPSSRAFTIRPFYTIHETGDHTFQASLMPAFFWQYKKQNTRELKGLFGFVDSLNCTHPGGINDYDLGIFPFIFYGDSPEKRDRYLMLWPLGGTVRGKLGQEEISAYAFPGFLLFVFFPPWVVASGPVAPYALCCAYLFISFMPLYTEYGRGDYRARGVLWPLYTRGKGDNIDVFRILPFYSRSTKKGWYDNRSYFLFVNYSETYYRDGVTRYNFFVVPFYGHKWSSSGDMEATAILWPFFSWGYNTRNGEKEYNVPWPFVQLKDCTDPFVYKRVFFPFYGDYRYKKERSFFVTPFYFTLHNDSDTINSAYYYYCMIIWYFRRDYQSEHQLYGQHWRFFKIWPVFKVEYNDRGDMSFNLLSLLPLRDPEGYEALYEPFWSIVEYRKSANGEKRLGLLFRTYYRWWSDSFIQVQVPILFSYSSASGNLRSWSVIFSMFGYVNKPDGRYARFFWIPVRTGEGDPETPAEKVSRIECENRTAAADIYCNMMLARRDRDGITGTGRGLVFSYARF